jgi:hypothetical protein
MMVSIVAPAPILQSDHSFFQLLISVFILANRLR